jgi:hypothetical protein
MAKQIVNVSLLQAALIGFEFQRDQVQNAIAEIRAELGGDGRESAEAPKKRTMSSSARRRIALAQKRRWAAFHKAKAEPTKQPRKKRKMSAAGRARIIAATKKRWAAFHKAKAKAA